MLSLTALQFECHSEQDGAAVEGVVVDVGVDAARREQASKKDTS